MTPPAAAKERCMGGALVQSALLRVVNSVAGSRLHFLRRVDACKSLQKPLFADLRSIAQNQQKLSVEVF